MQEDNQLNQPNSAQKVFDEAAAKNTTELIVEDDSTDKFEIKLRVLPDDRYTGKVIDNRFEVIRRLGRNTNNAVYEANDLLHGRTVALKVLKNEFDSESAVNRFMQECKILSLLKHVNIVKYCAHGTTAGGDPYLAMEYVHGKSLQQIIEDEGAISSERVVKVCIQICAALAVAHDRQIIHRDLKPANIMLTVDGNGNEVVKILDFGVSKYLPFQGETFQTRTQTGEMLGSILYMSPEQCLDQDLDGRSDIYSLGCVMFEALTGVPPLAARTAFETMNKHMTQIPQSLYSVRPDLPFPRELDVIIQKCLEKKSGDRYTNMAVLESQLVSLLTRLKDPKSSSNVLEFANSQQQTEPQLSSGAGHTKPPGEATNLELIEDPPTSYTIADLSPDKVRKRILQHRLMRRAGYQPAATSYSESGKAVAIGLWFGIICCAVAATPYGKEVFTQSFGRLQEVGAVVFVPLLIWFFFAVWPRIKK